jgi:protein SCO1
MTADTTRTRSLIGLVAGALLLLLSTADQAAAQTVLPKALQNVGFDQRLNEQVPLELPFTDDEGERVTLRKYFGDKPVILVLAYYRCPMLCTQVLNGLVQGLREMPFTVGKEFSVVTVSFDPNETTDMAAAKKRTYLHSYGKPEAAAGWHFLTGDQHAIARLTRAVGFRYAYDSLSDQYAHAAGIVILTPTGKISRYFYDVHYSGRDLRLGLVEASHNKIGSPIDQILLFCFHYDPTAGKYGAAIMNFVRLGGVLTMVGLGLMIGLLVRGERVRRRAAVQSESVSYSLHGS